MDTSTLPLASQQALVVGTVKRPTAPGKAYAAPVTLTGVITDLALALDLMMVSDESIRCLMAPDYEIVKVTTSGVDNLATYQALYGESYATLEFPAVQAQGTFRDASDSELEAFLDTALSF